MLDKVQKIKLGFGDSNSIQFLGIRYSICNSDSVACIQ